MNHRLWLGLGASLVAAGAAVAACSGSDPSSDPPAGGGTVDGAVAEGGSVDGGAADGALTDGATTPDGGGPTVYVDGGALAAPRPIAPLSTATVSKAAPKLTWELRGGADGAKVEICSDRACSTVEQAFVAAGTSASVPAPLTPGVHFWRLHAKVGNAIGAPVSPTWELVVGHRSAARDGSWGAFPDFDGDGFADFAFGADNARAVTVIRGAVVGIDDSSPRTVLTPPALPVNRFEFVANAGDVDGDGYPDLAIGQTCFDPAPCAAGATVVYVYRGGPNGGAIPSGVTDGGTVAAPASYVLPSPDGDDTQYGRTVRGVGDVNGDGYADLLVGSPVAPGGGRAYVFLGSAMGVSVAQKILLTGDGSSSFAIGAAGPGDVDGDGFADVVVNSGTTLFLFRGSATGPSTMTRGAFTLPVPFEGASMYAGVSPSAGDLDGDGYPDIALGLYGASGDAGAQGGVVIFRGTSSVPDLLLSDATLNGPILGGSFGFATAIAGDVDGDGFDDLAVGAPTNAYGTGGVGSAYLLPGSSTGVSDSVRIALADPSGGGGFGILAAAGGSIQGTGRSTALFASYIGDYVRVYAFGTDRSVTSHKLSGKPVGRWNYPGGLE
jgi:hypothetical protein